MAVRPDTNSGFSTGIRYWLLFMLCFALLGYTPFLSICLGALGGIAGGVLAAWWKAKDDGTVSKEDKKAEELKEIKQEVIMPGRRVRFRKYGTSPFRRPHLTQGARRFGWLFRRKA